jgi:hypothetical protein
MPEIELLRRQERQSPYDEFLYLVDLDGGEFSLQRRVHESVGPIHILPQRSAFYDSRGSRIEPDTFEGNRVIGYLDIDGVGKDYEYAVLERRVQTPFELDVVQFDATTIGNAKKFCITNGWSAWDGFDATWKQVESIARGRWFDRE